MIARAASLASFGHVCAEAPSGRPHTVTVLTRTVTEAAKPTSSAAEFASSRRPRRWPTETLTASEALALLHACSRRAPTGIRNQALIVVLWRCGLRIGEALTLELRDIDLDLGTIRVRHGKGDKARVVGVDEQTGALLARWIDRRRTLNVGARSAVFCTLKGGRLNDSYVRRLLPRLARKAGITKRVHPHGLRHTHAAELVRERVPVNVIRDALGHSSLAVTDRYLRDVAPIHVIDTMRSRSWNAPAATEDPHQS
jgi:site-specific recombinase XerD